MEKWTHYLDTLNWGSGYRDKSGYDACLRAASLGIDLQTAQQEIVRRIQVSGVNPDVVKLAQQARRAYEYVTQHPCDCDISLPAQARPEFDREILRRVAEKTAHVNKEWLKGHSPIPVSTCTASQFLNSLYKEGEKVLLFVNLLSQGDVVYTIGESTHSDPPQRGADGVWYLTNPVSGEYRDNPRLQKPSRRSEEAITSWRYAVLECDHEKDHPGVNKDWLSVLVQLPLCIAAIYTSGGKSIHALVRLDASSKADWDQQIQAMKPILVPLGADPQAMTAVRLSRLPQCYRGEHLQELLYLDPNPSCTPIVARNPQPKK